MASLAAHFSHARVAAAPATKPSPRPRARPDEPLAVVTGDIGRRPSWVMSHKLAFVLTALTLALAPACDKKEEGNKDDKAAADKKDDGKKADDGKAAEADGGEKKADGGEKKADEKADEGGW